MSPLPSLSHRNHFYTVPESLLELLLPFPKDDGDVGDVERELRPFNGGDDDTLSGPLGEPELLCDIRPSLANVDDHERRFSDAADNLREYSIHSFRVGDPTRSILKIVAYRLNRFVSVVERGIIGERHCYKHVP